MQKKLLCSAIGCVVLLCVVASVQAQVVAYLELEDFNLIYGDEDTDWRIVESADVPDMPDLSRGQALQIMSGNTFYAVYHIPDGALPPGDYYVSARGYFRQSASSKRDIVVDTVDGLDTSLEYVDATNEIGRTDSQTDNVTQWEWVRDYPGNSILPVLTVPSGDWTLKIRRESNNGYYDCLAFASTETMPSATVPADGYSPRVRYIETLMDDFDMCYPDLTELSAHEAWYDVDTQDAAWIVAQDRESFPWTFAYGKDGLGVRRNYTTQDAAGWAMDSNGNGPGLYRYVAKGVYTGSNAGRHTTLWVISTGGVERMVAEHTVGGVVSNYVTINEDEIGSDGMIRFKLRAGALGDGNQVGYLDFPSATGGGQGNGGFDLYKVQDRPIMTCAEVLAAGQSLSADLNSDCYVEWADFGIFASQWQLCADPQDVSCTLAP